MMFLCLSILLNCCICILCLGIIHKIIKRGFRFALQRPAPSPTDKGQNSCPRPPSTQQRPLKPDRGKEKRRSGEEGNLRRWEWGGKKQQLNHLLVITAPSATKPQPASTSLVTSTLQQSPQALGAHLPAFLTFLKNQMYKCCSKLAPVPFRKMRWWKSLAYTVLSLLKQYLKYLKMWCKCILENTFIYTRFRD